ncbi:MAG TPA: hypothetical protein VMC85_19415 [Desulfomonilaceae bacterium]|nr:hypothetical protein [Desulfomonilaceae bacterium]
MEFWIGLSIGLHLRGLVPKHLERFIEARGLLSPEACETINCIEQVEDEVREAMDEVVK